MSGLGIAVLAIIVAVPVLVALEGRRQRKRLEELGQTVKTGGGTDLAGAGMLQLQSLLQPDRKVEILLHKEQDHHEEAEPGGGEPK